MRILFVEDDVEIGTMYASQLLLEDNDVVHVRNAQEAIDILDEEEFDLIVLDILLPGSNGIAVLQELRSYRDWRQIPVIVLSNITPEDLQVSDSRLEELGVRKYLVKMETTPQHLASAVAALA